jgi:hypothetical protein
MTYRNKIVRELVRLCLLSPIPRGEVEALLRVWVYGGRELATLDRSCRTVAEKQKEKIWTKGIWSERSLKAKF